MGGYTPPSFLTRLSTGSLYDPPSGNTELALQRLRTGYVNREANAIGAEAEAAAAAARGDVPPIGPDYARTPGHFGSDGRFESPVSAEPTGAEHAVADIIRVGGAGARQAGSNPELSYLMDSTSRAPQPTAPPDNEGAEARLEAASGPGGDGSGILFGGAGGGNNTMADLEGQLQAQHILNALQEARDQNLAGTLKREAAFDPNRRKLESEQVMDQIEQALPATPRFDEHGNFAGWGAPTSSAFAVDREAPGGSPRLMGGQHEVLPRAGYIRSRDADPKVALDNAFQSLSKLDAFIADVDAKAQAGDAAATEQSQLLKDYRDRIIESLKLRAPAVTGRALYPAPRGGDDSILSDIAAAGNTSPARK